jgi:hypothetical protein
MGKIKEAWKKINWKSLFKTIFTFGLNKLKEKANE